MIKLSSRQSAIIAYVLEHSAVEDNVKLLSFSLTGSEAPGKQVIAYAKVLHPDEELFLLFTLSDFSDRIFMTVSDGDPKELSKVLATLEEYDHYSNKLLVGSSVKMPSAYLSGFGKIGVILLAASTSPLLIRVGKCIRIKGSVYHPYLVTFIDEQEYALKSEKGFDELLNQFERTDKDLVSLIQAERD